MKNLNSIKAKGKVLLNNEDIKNSSEKKIFKFGVTFLSRLTYAYIISDTFLKTYTVREKGYKFMGIVFIDNACFHYMASLTFPAFVISNSIKFSNIFFVKYFTKLPLFAKYGPSILAIICIPFIMKPVDNLTEFILNSTIRNFYNNEMLI